MKPGDSGVAEKLRTDELASLLGGLPPDVLATALERALERLTGPSRDTLALTIELVRTKAAWGDFRRPRPQKGEEPAAAPLLEAVLSVLWKLPREAQDVLSSSTFDAAVRSALGPEED